MPLLSGITGFLDKYVLGYALGVASGPALEPFVQDLANEAWQATQFRPLDAEIAAAVAAEDVDAYDRMAEEATLTGLNGGRFKDLYGETLNAPGIGELFQLWRRGLIDDAGFLHGLRKAKLESRWDTPLEGLRDVLLDPSQLANAQQQGFIDQVRANSEGGLQGMTAERQQILFELSGLPPSVGEGLDMLRRGIINSDEFAELVRTGHTKTKWTAQLEALQHRVLNHNDYVQARLRAWIDDPAMYAGGELTGYDRQAMDLLLKIHGRPLSWHQVFIGLRRGGTFDGPTTGIDPAFLKAMQESDIRPEWYNLAWAQRYTYPTAFVLRTLTEAGDLTEQDTHDILLFEGWEPTLAAKVAAKWATPAGAKADPWVGKADTQLWTATHKAYKGNGITVAQAQASFDLIGIDAAAQTEVLARWDAEKAL